MQKVLCCVKRGLDALSDDVALVGVVTDWCVSENESDGGCRDSIPEQLLDEVDVGHEHTATAVACQAELVHGVTARVVREGVRGL